MELMQIMENPSNPATVTLFEVIAQVETRGDCKGIRFEPATYAKLSLVRTDSEKLIISKISTANNCSWNSALMIYSCSFGAVQLMGFNLYGPACHYDKSIFDYCADKVSQAVTFDLLIRAMKLDSVTPQLLADSALVRHHFAVTYNGAPSYADNIAASLKHFQFNVKD